MTYPILDHDIHSSALIEPSKVVRPKDVPEHCVICFFKEVLDELAARPDARLIVENRWEDGPHPLYELSFQGKRLAFFHPGIGAPLAGSLFEELVARGCRKFIACGGCGVLEKDIAVGNLIVVSSAVRDEGFSYHYLAPAGEIQACEAGVDALVKTLTGHKVPYRVGKTWTTDAPYRETPNEIALRRQQGCLTVEMESAALIAVAQVRGATFGQVLYGGDDLSGAEWDNRAWQSKRAIRENLFWLCAEACLSL
jgi:uridine phosphorylase